MRLQLNCILSSAQSRERVAAASSIDIAAFGWIRKPWTGMYAISVILVQEQIQKPFSPRGYRQLPRAPCRDLSIGSLRVYHERGV